RTASRIPRVSCGRPDVWAPIYPSIITGTRLVRDRIPRSMPPPDKPARAGLTLTQQIMLGLVLGITSGTLVAGIAGAGHVKAVGRMGLRAMIYFEVVTTIALLIGLLAVNIFKPG